LKRRKEDDLPNIQNNCSTKKVVQDGFSWWNCLSMDLPMEMTKPNAVKKTNKM